MFKIQVEDQINYAGIMRVVSAAREQVVSGVAQNGAKRASYNAPYDTGRLSESIDAEAMADDERAWGVYARTPYALIQELRQPYLYSGCLEAASGRGLTSVVRKNKLGYRTAKQQRRADRARIRRQAKAERRESTRARKGQKRSRGRDRTSVPASNESNRETNAPRK